MKSVGPGPRAEADNQEEYVSCKGFPWGVRCLNPMLGSPAQSTRVGRDAHITSGCETSEDPVCQRERKESARKPVVHLKKKCTKSHSQPPKLGSRREGAAWSGLESCEKRLGCMAAGRELG